MFGERFGAGSSQCKRPNPLLARRNAKQCNSHLQGGTPSPDAGNHRFEKTCSLAYDGTLRGRCPRTIAKVASYGGRLPAASSLGNI
jgi:hypothetical protein